MTALPAIFIYCVLIVAGSVLGGWLPSLVRLTHTRMQLMVSFVGGLMLGVGLFHLIPHSVVYTHSLDRAIWWMVLGLLTTFFLIRVFQFHEHAAAETPEPISREHLGHADSADDGHDLGQRKGRRVGRGLSWVGVAVGLSLHTLIDGVALGAAVVSESRGGALLPGLSIFVVVLLHKPLDALSITSLMATGGWPMRTRQVVNVGFALMCPLGAILFATGVENQENGLVGCALAFAGGVFVCISLGDLLPEVHFHTHDRVKLSAALLIGISAAYAIGFLEPHAHEDVPAAQHSGIESPGHEHRH